MVWSFITRNKWNPRLIWVSWVNNQVVKDRLRMEIMRWWAWVSNPATFIGWTISFICHVNNFERALSFIIISYIHVNIEVRLFLLTLRSKVMVTILVVAREVSFLWPDQLVWGSSNVHTEAMKSVSQIFSVLKSKFHYVCTSFYVLVSQ